MKRDLVDGLLVIVARERLDLDLGRTEQQPLQLAARSARDGQRLVKWRPGDIFDVEERAARPAAARVSQTHRAWTECVAAF